jgi:hypothetical protein
MKSRTTSEIFVDRPIRAGEKIRPVKRNYASTDSIDAGAKNERLSIQNSFENHHAELCVPAEEVLCLGQISLNIPQTKHTGVY